MVVAKQTHPRESPAGEVLLTRFKSQSRRVNVTTLHSFTESQLHQYKRPSGLAVVG